MSDHNPHTVCIIGGGMSGLFTGALLAKNGYQVTVLEKNHIIGGGLQSFRRGDAVFNTGMQAFAGYKENFAFEYYWKYLGIEIDSLHFFPYDSIAQEIVWVDQDHCYKLPKTRKAYTQYLIEQFPNQREGILKLMECIYDIGNTFDYFWLRPKQIHPEAAKYGVISSSQLIRTYISDERLALLFEYVGMHLGYNLSVLPSTELGMILNLYIEGGWRIAGGNLSLAEKLADYINTHGGQVLNNAEVCEIVECNKTITSIKTTDGRRFEADTFVCAISPKAFVHLAKADFFRESTQERINEYQNDSSCCICHIKLKENSFPFQNHMIFMPALSQDNYLPRYISMITPLERNQGEWASTMEILSFTHYSYFEKWGNTCTGDRGDDYANMKQQIAQEIIDHVSHYYPKLKQSIDQKYLSTPLTIRDYFANPLGATYGQQGVFIPIKTKSKNLFMTGQSVQYQGLFGVMITSILSAETILGRSLISEIAKA